MAGVLSVGDQVIAMDIPGRVDCSGVPVDTITTMLHSTKDRLGRVMYVIHRRSPPPNTTAIQLPVGCALGVNLL